MEDNDSMDAVAILFHDDNSDSEQEGEDAVYSAVALHHPTVDDINRLLDEWMKSGFSGCIGSS